MRKVHPDFPASFGSKQKALLLFQKLDGVDVLLYVMFLQEYGSECPAPNARCVYLSYLDSVNFLRPTMCRTAVYHEVIISTMEFVRLRGFSRFFIWACPPVNGDEYIFNVRKCDLLSRVLALLTMLDADPKSQRTPKPEQLRAWYFTLLEEARQRGVAVSVTNFFDEYLARVSELKHVPYLEGDCWTGLLEQQFDALGEDGSVLVERKQIVQKARKQLGGDKPSEAKRGAKRGRKKAPEAEEQVPPEKHESGLRAALRCPPPMALTSVPTQSALTWKVCNEIERVRDDFVGCVSCGPRCCLAFRFPS
jgi:E1A/CREB-binding protein